MLLSSRSGEKRTSFLGAEVLVWAHSEGTRTTQTTKNFWKERMETSNRDVETRSANLNTPPVSKQFPDIASHCIGREQYRNCQRNTTHVETRHAASLQEMSVRTPLRETSGTSSGSREWISR